MKCLNVLLYYSATQFLALICEFALMLLFHADHSKENHFIIGLSGFLYGCVYLFESPGSVYCVSFSTCIEETILSALTEAGQGMTDYSCYVVSDIRKLTQQQRI